VAQKSHNTKNVDTLSTEVKAGLWRTYTMEELTKKS
jgi:hypothetical protein